MNIITVSRRSRLLRNDSLKKQISKSFLISYKPIWLTSKRFDENGALKHMKSEKPKLLKKYLNIKKVS